MCGVEPGEMAAMLRAWARGSLPMAAGVEMLLRAFGGRFSHHACSWVVIEEDGCAWVDTDALRSGTGALSGRERRVLVTAAALIEDAPVDVVTGVDRANLHLILAALAHAAGLTST